MEKPKDRQSARRAIRAIWVLEGHTIDGMRLTAIAEQLGTSLPNALRDLETLHEEGVVERIPGREECWRLTPRIIQVSRETDIEFARLRRQIDEHETRYSRLARQGE